MIMQEEIEVPFLLNLLVHFFSWCAVAALGCLKENKRKPRRGILGGRGGLFLAESFTLMWPFMHHCGGCCHGYYFLMVTDIGHTLACVSQMRSPGLLCRAVAKETENTNESLSALDVCPISNDPHPAPCVPSSFF